MRERSFSWESGVIVCDIREKLLSSEFVYERGGGGRESERKRMVGGREGGR